MNHSITRTFKALTLTFALSVVGTAQAQRTVSSINADWRFALGNAASMEKDYTHGTEYFTYLTKAGSAGQNQGPVNEKFDDSLWKKVNLPFDWVVDLPYSGQASHSHGYKQIGWKYPEHSVGWYRKQLFIDKSDDGKSIYLCFDGIFRHAEVFINGFFLGEEPSGYATQTYNITDYVNYGGNNLITVRCDASTEEGWYYEGAGIYRNTWLIKTALQHVSTTASHYEVTLNENHSKAVVNVTTGLTNDAYQDATVNVSYKLKDKKGNVCASAKMDNVNLASNGSSIQKTSLSLSNPILWSADTPYLYQLETTVYNQAGEQIDQTQTSVGVRTLSYNKDLGFAVNGQSVKLKGCDLHLDHAGVGVGLPNALWVYKLKKLKELGMNAIRCSHNPASPAMLDVCDSLGFYVIDENRLMGTTDQQLDLLKRMVDRDRNHPSVVMWSIGNEEWAIESGDRGERLARRMNQFVHQLDNSRPTTYGNSGGFGVVKEVDIHGYNYIVQNDVDNRHKQYPDWVIVGTEETSGCGTRGVYQTDSITGRMAAINWTGEKRTNGEKNVIERGWKFYRDHPWAGGIFYWTGFDYRGEPNPMVWPSTGSEFGILDYCGFPKDEAYYLKAAWTSTPVVHAFPNPCVIDTKEVWVYSNCDEVELKADNKSLGKQTMPKDGHLVWNITQKPKKLVAEGYIKGKKVESQLLVAPSDIAAAEVALHSSSATDVERQIVVADICLVDKKNNTAARACDDLFITVPDGYEIVGWGNGDPAFKDVERPTSDNTTSFKVKAFNGMLQVILKNNGETSVEKPLTIQRNGKTLPLHYQYHTL